MKKTYHTPILLLLLLLNFSKSNAQVDSVLVSNVEFNNAKYNNPHAGSGFLLEYKNKIYAITAKHVLFFAKTDSMKTVSFNGDLKLWEFNSKVLPNKKIIAGKLINENSNELIEMPPKGDWLIFETNKNIPKNVAIYQLREDPLKLGEEVYFLGYPYKSKKSINIKGTYIGLTKDNNLRLNVPKSTYNGCSGGPVLDKQGKLVGLVSMGYFNEKENKMIFEPASLGYFIKTIESYIDTKHKL